LRRKVVLPKEVWSLLMFGLPCTSRTCAYRYLVFRREGASELDSECQEVIRDGA
jgi:hypothetical protein